MRFFLVVPATIAAGCGSAWAEDADRVANINKAAAEIAAIQEKSGANGAFAAINECYQRELAVAKSLTRGLETCMTQDIIVSNITAVFYGQMSENARKMAKVPEPGAVKDAMIQRVVGTARRFKVPEEDAREFRRLVQQHGMQAYGQTRFPKQFPAKTP
jgi:hypothetical protein